VRKSKRIYPTAATPYSMIKAFVSIYLLGLLICSFEGVIGSDEWLTWYYIWQKTFDGGVFVWFLLLKMLPRSQKWLIKPVFLFSIIRFLLTVSARIFNFDINSAPVVSGFSLILLITCAWLLISEQSRVNNYLTKYLNV